MAAAIAIPFVLLSIWADQNQSAAYAAAQRRFVIATLGAGVALVGWEFIQSSSSTLVYDAHDIGATIVGLGVSWLLFTLVTPSISGAERATTRARRVEEQAGSAKRIDDDLDYSNR